MAKQEHDQDEQPVITNEQDIRIKDYDNIFIGYPMWWSTFPMILYTLFDHFDFTGKTIIPFNTHMGSGDGGTYRTIAQLEPGAKVLQGLPVEMGDAGRGVQAAVAGWLTKLGFDKEA